MGVSDWPDDGGVPPLLPDPAARPPAVKVDDVDGMLSPLEAVDVDDVDGVLDPVDVVDVDDVDGVFAGSIRPPGPVPLTYGVATAM